MSAELTISIIALVVSSIVGVVSIISGVHAIYNSRALAGLKTMSDCQKRFDECDKLFRKLNLYENNTDCSDLSEDEVDSIRDDILNNMEYYAFLVNNKYLGDKESKFHSEYFVKFYERLEQDIEKQRAENSDTFIEIVKLYDELKTRTS